MSKVEQSSLDEQNKELIVKDRIFGIERQNSKLNKLSSPEQEPRPIEIEQNVRKEKKKRETNEVRRK